MKAVVCTEFEPFDRLAVSDITEPACEPDCVKIKVACASINPPDILMAEGRYQVKPALPFVLGVECSGVVSEIGEGVERLRVGDRVMVYAGQGCFAEQVVVPADLAFPVPDGMDDTVAAGFVLAYSTVYHGLSDCGKLAPGEKLVVLGAAGGLGMAAIQVGKSLGAIVIAAASTPAKRDLCHEHGADHVIDSSPSSFRENLRELTEGAGADMVFDSVGGPITEAALRSMAPYGRLLIAGYASGEIPQIKANLVLLKQAQVLGVSYRLFAQREPAAAHRNMDALAELWRAGAFRIPRPEVFPASRIVDALKLVAQRRVMGKAAISFDQGGGIPIEPTTASRRSA